MCQGGSLKDSRDPEFDYRQINCYKEKTGKHFKKVIFTRLFITKHTTQILFFLDISVHNRTPFRCSIFRLYGTFHSGYKYSLGVIYGLPSFCRHTFIFMLRPTHSHLITISTNNGLTCGVFCVFECTNLLIRDISLKISQIHLFFPDLRHL